jgi:hypothetical protein
MRQITWILLLFFAFGYSQKTIKGKVLEATTSEALPFVNLFSSENNQGVYTNLEGYFEFQIPNGVQSITISCLGYKTIVIPIENFNEKEQIIRLEPEEYALEEVVVVNKPLHEIMNNLVSNSKNQLDRDVKLDTYYREFLKINDQYSKFSDGLVTYYLQPKRKDKVKANVVVNESRAFEITAANDLEYEGKADLSALDTFFNFKDATDSFFNFNMIENFLTNAKSSKKYDFQIKTYQTQSGVSFEKIVIKPLSEVQELLVEGYIIYDAASKVIIEYDLQLADTHKQYSELRNMLLFKFKLNDLQVKVSFRMENGKYIPNYNKTVFDLYMKFGKQINDNLSGVCDLLVNNYSNTNVILPAKETFYAKRSLYENGMKHHSNYWKSNLAMPLSSNEEAILNQLMN